MATIRVLRILEYVGEEQVVWDNLRKAGVPPNGEIDFRIHGGIQIKSGLVGFPDLVFEEKKDDH